MQRLDSEQQAALAATLAQDAPAIAAGLSRRDFLRAGGAGLVVSATLAFPARAFARNNPAAVGAPTEAPLAPNAFIRVGSDNLVTVVIKHHEMGQGATTGLATIAADELDADWSLVRAEYAPSDPKLYNNTVFGPMQGTGGSSAVANSFEQMRKAGATARAMLVQAAAAKWKVPAAEIKTSNSLLTHASGKRATYGEMAEAAGALTPPAEVKLKQPSEFTLIGKDKNGARRLDSVAKTNGTALYTIDVKLPGLLTAVIAHPPAPGAKLKSFDASASKKVKGVTDVVEVPEGVAVVAKGMWPALQGRKALKLEWDESGVQDLSSEQLLKTYRELAAKPGDSIHRSPQTKTALAQSAKTVEAVYEFPFLAHATMEPMNCVAWMHDGILETWAGHQVQTLDHGAAAKAAGLPLEKVKLNTLVSGGSFGRRANPQCDYTVAAVNVAKAIGWRAPVRLQYTREDDMRAGQYRPMYVHAVKAGLDAQGRITGWQHTIVGQSIQAGGPFAMMVKDGVDATSVEGVWPTPYAIPNFSGDSHAPVIPVRPLWWRSVGHTHTAYAMEATMDELAAAAGKDPVEFRLAYLQKDPRSSAVLKLAAEKAGWGKPLPAGRAQGIAVHHSFESYVAQVAEVSLGADGQPKVERVICAVDCGVAVNPDVIRAQMEGGIGFALSALYYGEIRLDKGRAVEGNFHEYRVLRMHEMPVVEVHIVDSQAAPTGVGEPGVPPLAPAVANAVARLTRSRVRQLPLRRNRPLSV